MVVIMIVVFASGGYKKIEFILLLSIILSISYYYRIYGVVSVAVEKRSPDGEDEDENDDAFYKLATSGRVFVDKSSLIEDYVRSEKSVCRITRPDGWGKTTNLDMLRKFLEVDRNSSSVRSKLFTGGCHRIGNDTIRLKRLKISESDTMMNEHRGRYPVIYLNLNRIRGRNYDEIERKLKTLTVDLFRKHCNTYLTKSRPLSCDPDALLDVKQFVDGTIDSTRLSYGLAFLSELLGKYYRRTVYVLIDDYDKPIRSVLKNYVTNDRRSSDDYNLLFADAYKSDDFRRTDELLKRFLTNGCYSGRNDNYYAVKCLMTGVFDLDFSSSNNNNDDKSSESIHYDMTDEKYSRYFGFTETEITDLLQERNLSDVALLGTLTEWYGYHFHSRPIYNPFSIGRFLNDSKSSDYYKSFRIYRNETDVETDFSDYFLLTDVVQETLYDLLEGNVIRKYVTPTIGRDSILHPDRAFSYLTYSGYLIPIGYFYDERQLSLPNLESKRYVRGKVLKWLRLKTNGVITAARVLSLAERLADLDADGFRNELADDLLSLSGEKNSSPISLRSTVTIYEAIMKCVSLALETDYEYRCNSRWGRQQGKFANITLIAKSPSTGGRRKNAIIIDYKQIDDRTTDVRYETIVGLNAINRRMYDISGERYPHVECIMKMAVVFSGARLGVDYQIDENY